MADSATLGARNRLGTPAIPRALGEILLRAETRLRRPWLDAEIARGGDGSGGRALALREAQLVAPRGRRRLARRFEEILEARPTVPRLSSAVPIDHRAVAVAKPLLSELIRTLRSSEVVEARGIVLARRLLTDALSPIYGPPSGEPGGPDRLWYEALVVLFALRPLAAATVATQAVGPS
jgi:hypothetical protein